VQVFSGSLTLETTIALQGKPAHQFFDPLFQRLFVLDYQNPGVQVFDAHSGSRLLELGGLSFPTFLSFSAEYLFVSDFWGHRLVLFHRDSLEWAASIPVRRGPGFSLVEGSSLFLVSQLEYALQVFDLESLALRQSFELEGRVPRFFLFDDLLVLPYYDNYHTWSRDFELEDSIGFINLDTMYRWSIRGVSKKPLHVIRLEQGVYLAAGYLDRGIWLIRWGETEVQPLVSWQGYSHLMDMVLFHDRLVLASMSEESLLSVFPDGSGLVTVPAAGGMIDLEPVGDSFLAGISNFENRLLLFDSTLKRIAQIETGDYPISVRFWQGKLFVLCMDEPCVQVYSLEGLAPGGGQQ